MKKILICKPFKLNEFLSGMDSGYSGQGSESEGFTIKSFNGKDCEPFTIPWSLYSAWQAYKAVKNTLNFNLKQYNQQ